MKLLNHSTSVTLSQPLTRVFLTYPLYSSIYIVVRVISPLLLGRLAALGPGADSSWLFILFLALLQFFYLLLGTAWLITVIIESVRRQPETIASLNRTVILLLFVLYVATLLCLKLWFGWSAFTVLFQNGAWFTVILLPVLLIAFPAVDGILLKKYSR